MTDVRKLGLISRVTATPRSRRASARAADVLIIDDDLDLSDAVAEVVASEGHVVRTAQHGREGLQKVYERKPDVIVVDLEMPVLDGPAMLRRLRSIEPDGAAIPFILVSGVERLEKIAEAVGTPYWLCKPFTIDSLVLVIERAMTEPWTPTTDSSGP